MPEQVKIAALILAAGRSTRMGSNKMLALLDGKPLVRHVAEVALAAGFGEVIVVTGHEAALVEAALEGCDLQFAHNRDFVSGMASSLRCGLEVISPDVAGALVLLGDMPRVSSAAIRALADAFWANPDKLAIVPLVGGERGNPVLLSRGILPVAMRLTGDRGARKLLEEAGDAVLELPLNDPALLLDVDTPEALRAITNPA